MKKLPAAAALVALVLVSSPSRLPGADLSPGNWPRGERDRLEKLESLTWSPQEARTIGGKNGIV